VTGSDVGFADLTISQPREVIIDARLSPRVRDSMPSYQATATKASVDGKTELVASYEFQASDTQAAEIAADVGRTPSPILRRGRQPSDYMPAKSCFANAHPARESVRQCQGIDWRRLCGTGNLKEAQVQAGGAVRLAGYHAVDDGKLPNSKRPDGSRSGLLDRRLCTDSLASGSGRQTARSGEARRASRLQAGGHCSRDKALGRRLRRLRLKEQHNSSSRKQ
jgi:hypothetical protein